MKRDVQRREGVSLIEFLVVIAILAVFLALLLPAVQSARISAARMSDTNSVKQTLLASHHFAHTHGEQWPSADGNSGANVGNGSLISALCTYLEADPFHPPRLIRFRADPSRWAADNLPKPPGGAPALTDPELNVSSLAFNPLVYSGGVRFTTLTDGTTNTIAVTEHYGVCGEGKFHWQSISTDCYESEPIFRRVLCSSASPRRTTFADGKMFRDVTPVTVAGAAGPVSRGSLPLTFQVRPRLDQCDPRIPQSSFPGGILCGIADGGVRFVRAGVSEEMFWGAVTPNRGEVTTLD